jgi:hypothetical protein
MGLILLHFDALLQRYNLNCYLCNKKKAGACMQCEDCYKAFHPMCAQKANCFMSWHEVKGAVVRAPRAFVAVLFAAVVPRLFLSVVCIAGR